MRFIKWYQEISNWTFNFHVFAGWLLAALFVFVVHLHLIVSSRAHQMPSGRAATTLTHLKHLTLQRCEPSAATLHAHWRKQRKLNQKVFSFYVFAEAHEPPWKLQLMSDRNKKEKEKKGNLIFSGYVLVRFADSGEKKRLLNVGQVCLFCCINRERKDRSWR